MLIELAQHVVADAKAREAEGDCPSPRRYSAEQVEAALVTVADALLAAEAERDALREALRSIEFQCETAVINLRQMPGDNKPASRAFLSLMNSARALTQEQPNVRE